MVDRNAVLAAIAETMERYHKKMIKNWPDWWPLEIAAQLLLDGMPLDYDRYHPDFRPLIKMMQTIMEYTKHAAWDWGNPDIQKVFVEVAGSAIYKLFSETLVDMLVGVLKNVPVATIVEAGAGSGIVSTNLCRALQEYNLNSVRLIISDQLPSIQKTGEAFRAEFPALAISDFVWNVKQPAPPALKERLLQPVLVFERFCLPYAGTASLHNIASLADILFIIDDLSLTGKKASFDHIYEKIGTQFLIFDEVKQELEKYFSLINICDREVVTAVNSPVTTFTLAAK